MTGIVAIMGGIASVAVKLVNSSVFSGATSPAHATGTVNVNNTGTVTGDGVSSYSWLLSGSASSYEIRATLSSQSGMASQTGTYGSWLALSSSQSWSFTANTGSGSAIIQLEIRPVGGSTITNCRVVFDCEVS